MPDRPMIFSRQMVRALLDGRKTQTRRLAWRGNTPHTHPETTYADLRASPWQRVQPGDRLWVREPWAPCASRVMYRADYGGGTGWRPSIHMPRWASRITLHVEAVRVERLQAISEEDAQAEGADAADTTDPGDPGFSYSRREGFRILWNSLHGPGAWEANPEVVALTFRVVKGNIDA